MVKKAVILGYDAVSPLGTDMETQWERAVRGESGVGPLTRFPMTEGFPVRIAGQVGEWDASPYPFLSPRKLAQWTSPIFKHAMLVAHRALLKSGVEITAETAPRTAVTFSSAVGGQDAVLKADRRMIREGRMPHPFTNPNACINMVGGENIHSDRRHRAHHLHHHRLRNRANLHDCGENALRPGQGGSCDLRGRGFSIGGTDCGGVLHHERRLSP